MAHARGWLLDLALLAVLALVAWGPRQQVARTYAEPIQSEERLYNRYAVPWALGQGAEPREKAFPWHPLGSFTHRPPGYALFVGSVYRVAGLENFAAVRQAQAVLDTWSVLWVYVLGALLFGGWLGRGVGFTAALAMARYDFLYLHVARILSESLFVWLMLAALIAALVAVRRRSWALVLVAGYILGWANLVRPFLLPAALGFVAWAMIAPGLTRRWRYGLAALVGLALAIAPVTWRNWQFHGALIPISTNSGFTLFKSISEVENLSAPADLGTEEQVDALELGEIAEQAEFRRRALAYMRRHPEDWGKIYSRKVIMLLDSAGGHKISHVLMVTPVDEWLYPLLLGGALVSLFVRPRVKWHGRLLLWLFIASQVLVCLLANAEVRYRVPLVPLFALLAAWSVWGLADLAWRRWRGAGVATAPAAAG